MDSEVAAADMASKEVTMVAEAVIEAVVAGEVKEEVEVEAEVLHENRPPAIVLIQRILVQKLYSETRTRA